MGNSASKAKPNGKPLKQTRSLSRETVYAMRQYINRPKRIIEYKFTLKGEEIDGVIGYESDLDEMLWKYANDDLKDFLWDGTAIGNTLDIYHETPEE
jgi:hypothetical protein